MRSYTVMHLETGKLWTVESDCMENAVYHVMIDILHIEFDETVTELYTYLGGFSLIKGDVTVATLPCGI